MSRLDFGAQVLRAWEIMKTECPIYSAEVITAAQPEIIGWTGIGSGVG